MTPSEPPATAAADMPAALAADTRFRNLFAHAPFSMQLLGADGRTLEVNRAWERIWGVEDIPSVKDYVLHGDYNILTDPQLEAKGITPYLRRAFAGESVSIPMIYYDPAELGLPGRGRWLRASAYPVRHADGTVQEVMLVHEDVTDQIDAQHDLREAEERLRIAVEAGNIGIWEWDIETSEILWSERVYALHGVDPAHFRPSIDSFPALIHPDDRPSLWEAVDEAVRTRTGFANEFRALLPDGGVRWLGAWARVATGRKDGAGRLIGAVISIDEHKRAQDILRDTGRRKDEFLAVLAHELRNPLAPVSAAADILRLPGLDEARVRNTADIIARQVGHMTRLIDELMDVSRVTRGLVELRTELLDVGAVIGQAVEQTRPLIEAHRHSLTIRMECGPVQVRGDRTRLVQILANLLNNASRYTPPGGEIRLEGRVADGGMQIVVADNGQGMDPGFLPHVFELFTQERQGPGRSQGGLGVGLALVKTIVQMHGGRVAAASEGSGRGSSFTVWLPLAEAETGDVHAAPAADTGPAQAFDILIVDDNLDAARLLAILLEADGHRVNVLESAGRALAQAAGLRPKVFILDIGLPDMTGHVLAERLRSLPETRDAVFIALTGYGQAHDRDRSRAAGFDHHLVKPVDTQRLRQILAEV